MKCKQCHKEIKRESNSQQYCGNKCRGLAYREKHRDKFNKYQRDRRRKKTKGEKVKCLICGVSFRQVGTHIVQRHNMTAREYRKRFGFDLKKGQLPQDLKELKSRQVGVPVIKGLIKNGKKHRFKKGQEGVGKYKRSKQTQARLKQKSFIKKKL